MKKLDLESFQYLYGETLPMKDYKIAQKVNEIIDILTIFEESNIFQMIEGLAAINKELLTRVDTLQSLDDANTIILKDMRSQIRELEEDVKRLKGNPVAQINELNYEECMSEIFNNGIITEKATGMHYHINAEKLSKVIYNLFFDKARTTDKERPFLG